MSTTKNVVIGGAAGAALFGGLFYLWGHRWIPAEKTMVAALAAGVGGATGGAAGAGFGWLAAETKRENELQAKLARWWEGDAALVKSHFTALERGAPAFPEDSLQIVTQNPEMATIVLGCLANKDRVDDAIELWEALPDGGLANELTDTAFKRLCSEPRFTENLDFESLSGIRLKLLKKHGNLAGAAERQLEVCIAKQCDLESLMGIYNHNYYWHQPCERDDFVQALASRDDVSQLLQSCVAKRHGYLCEALIKKVDGAVLAGLPKDTYRALCGYCWDFLARVPEADRKRRYADIEDLVVERPDWNNWPTKELGKSCELKQSEIKSMKS